MNALILMNQWGQRAFGFAWPMFWQSSVLFGVLFLLDLGLRRKVRANVRYALWLVVLIKLMLPPSFALPSGAGWWLRPRSPAAVVQREPSIKVIYGVVQSGSLERLNTPPPVASSKPAMSVAGAALLGWVSLSLALLGWTLVRSWQTAREIRQASAAPEWLQELLEETQRAVGVPYSVRLKLLEGSGSPTVAGLFCPTVLVPEVLLGQLVPDQMRAVLLHELMHVRRGDAWVNCAQTLLQIFYGWHPLLWLANARIRRVREEAVDDAVMLALGSRCGTYAPTLLEVAKVALRRPLASAGPIGILESRSFLRQRIERLIDFSPPAKGLTLVSMISILAFAAVALPMGAAPPGGRQAPVVADSTDSPWPDARFGGYAEIKLESQFLIASEASLRAVFPSLMDTLEPLVLSSNEVAELNSLLEKAQAQPYTSAEPLSFAKFSGGAFHWLVGGVTNNGVNYLTRSAGGQAVVTGADVTVMATQPNWIPLELTLLPWTADSGIRCQMRLGTAGNPDGAQNADVTIPRAGALVWAIPTGPGNCELVLFREKSADTNNAAPPSTQASAVGEEDRVGIVPANHAEVSTPPERESDQGVPAGGTFALEGKPWSFVTSSPGTSGTSIVRGTNGAQMKYGPITLKADQVMGIISNQQLVSVIADGNVRLQQGQQVLQSEHIRISPVEASTKTAAVSSEPTSTNAKLSNVQEVLNQAPLQINIKTKFIVLPEDSSASLAFLFAGTNPVGNFSAVLTPAQSAVLVKALESNPSVDLFREASVTTLSGRETEVQVVDLKTIVTNLNPQALSPPGISSKTNGTNGLYQTATNPFGPTLDSIASVLADGRHIELIANVRSTEFLGYDDPKTKVPAYVDGKRTLVVQPLPHFREGKISAKVVVPDGYTLLLATAMNDESLTTTPVPGLKKMRLLVLVKPIVIDPAGNRLHPEN